MTAERGWRCCAATVCRRWVLWWEEAVKGTPAGKVRMASPELVVEGIDCCYGLVEVGVDGDRRVKKMPLRASHRC